MKPTRAATAVICGALAFGAAACGGDSSKSSDEPTKETKSAAEEFAESSPEEVVDEIVEAMAGLESLRMAGEITSEGQEISLDLAMSTEGRCHGTIEVEAGNVELLATPKSSYMKADEGFWKASGGPQAEAVLELIGDRWVTAGPAESFAQFCDLDGFLEDFDEEESAPDFEVGDVEELDGQEVVELIGTGEDADTTVWVLADDPHYIVRLEGTDASDGATFTLSDFDEPVDAEDPPAKDVVDLNKLRQGG